MKREIERRKRLPAFLITIADLEILLNRLVAQCYPKESPYTSIDLMLNDEKLEFKSPTELRTYADISGDIKSFSLWLSGESGSVSLRGDPLSLGKVATVSAKSDSEAWCAGAVDVVYSFTCLHRAWYSRFIFWPFEWVLMLFSIFVGTRVAYLFGLGGFSANWKGIIASFAAIFVLTVLFVFKFWLLPAAVLRVSYKQGFFRRNAASLSLLVAILSLLVSVIGLIVTK